MRRKNDHFTDCILFFVFLNFVIVFSTLSKLKDLNLKSDRTMRKIRQKYFYLNSISIYRMCAHFSMLLDYSISVEIDIRLGEFWKINDAIYFCVWYHTISCAKITSKLKFNEADQTKEKSYDKIFALLLGLEIFRNLINEHREKNRILISTARVFRQKKIFFVLIHSTHFNIRRTRIVQKWSGEKHTRDTYYTTLLFFNLYFIHIPICFNLTRED